MQMSFSEYEYASKKRQTRRDRFLAAIETMTPWGGRVAAIEPHYPRGEGRGRPPIGLERMLRRVIAQNCLGLSDKGIEDAFFEQPGDPSVRGHRPSARGRACHDSIVSLTDGRTALYRAAAGAKVVELADVAKLVVARTVEALVNEAADLASWNTVRVADIDFATQLGTAYLRGPLAWGQVLGAARVPALQRNLFDHYDDTRHRAAPRLSESLWNGAALDA